MEKNNLIVEDNYTVYINNEDTHEYQENIFTEYANDYFKNEKVIDLKFKHYEIELSPNSHAQGRVVTINFTNGQKQSFDLCKRRIAKNGILENTYEDAYLDSNNDLCIMVTDKNIKYKKELFA
jgi:hypothetical protein